MESVTQTNTYLVIFSNQTGDRYVIGEIRAKSRKEAFKSLKDMMEEEALLEQFGITEELFCLTTRDTRIQLGEKVASVCDKIKFVKNLVL